MLLSDVANVYEAITPRPVPSLALFNPLSEECRKVPIMHFHILKLRH